MTAAPRYPSNDIYIERNFRDFDDMQPRQHRLTPIRTISRGQEYQPEIMENGDRRSNSKR